MRKLARDDVGTAGITADCITTFASKGLVLT
jgi:hypothetical protein